TAAAGENARAVDSAASNLGLVSRTAESHATSALQVSASTEEQSAACEQMSMASTQLFHGSHALLDLVSELKTTNTKGSNGNGNGNGRHTGSHRLGLALAEVKPESEDPSEN
ncbi:MAG: hypothetical protein ACXW2P_13255, partial [Thermoanaerobaculia bacterium]